ncbi:MAG: tRNA (cytidine(34)-2'-O)-methyltransferase, partial [Proteobacteria bacterium]|nr:tRNA (cytidine(34)-2'-O)-methyltransferase [Pseudomonadota bacterium]
TGCTLHLVRPLGFELDDTRLKRAGLDYHEWAPVRVHEDFDAVLAEIPGKIHAFTRNGAGTYTQARFSPGDGLLFGPETRGLPDDILATFPDERRLRLPMRPGNRSLNLSNAVAVAVYEAWRQQDFRGAD